MQTGSARLPCSKPACLLASLQYSLPPGSRSCRARSPSQAQRASCGHRKTPAHPRRNPRLSRVQTRAARTPALPCVARAGCHAHSNHAAAARRPPPAALRVCSRFAEPVGPPTRSWSSSISDPPGTLLLGRVTREQRAVRLAFSVAIVMSYYMCLCCLVHSTVLSCSFSSSPSVSGVFSLPLLTPSGHVLPSFILLSSFFFLFSFFILHSSFLSFFILHSSFLLLSSLFVS